MENVNFIEKLAAQFSQNATVKSVYGEPVVAGDKTIIPVARVAYGLGGGYGHGKNKMKHLHESPLANEEGVGGGGGMIAKPAGVLTRKAVQNSSRHPQAKF
jgi:uncharacterized spore protein YtfJ